MNEMTEKERIEWCFKFESGKRWLTAISVDKSGSRHTQREYARALKRFCDWIGKNPDQLIAERKTDTKGYAEDKLREFCSTLKTSRTTLATKYHAPIKSFYAHNRMPLTLPTPKHTIKERSPHTVEQIKILMSLADPRERAIMMLLKDSGISREDIVLLKYGDIQNEFETDKNVIHVRLVRQKEQIEYDTFIGKNAIESLKAYLQYRKAKGEKITKDSPIIATVSDKAMKPEVLSTIFVRLSKKAGFLTSPHRFRKYFESHMGLSAPSILVKYWMGHSLGVEKSYFMPTLEKQREAYTQAYKEIDISEKPEISEVERRKQQMRDSAKLMGWNEQKLEMLEQLLIQAKSTEEIDQIPERLKQLESHDCQKIISESELSQWLTQGYRFIAILPSGKILISNEA
jgi:integrase/recombinase XerD